MAEVTLEMLGVLIQRSIDEQAAIRRESRDIRSILLSLVDQSRRVERRVEEVRDDIDLMLKAELMGRLGHFETQIEGRLEAIERRLTPA